ncbi:Tll0287-like domain-containing protein [Rhizobium sp. CAU 1783]
MRIEFRFGLILAVCFVFGLAIAGYISFTLEFRQARAEVNEKSRVLLETGLALRSYTSKEVAPLVKKLGYEEFHPQMVPSYGAQTTLGFLRDRFPDYRYREASLNPTNIADRANDWEVTLLQTFQQDAELKELSGEVGAGADKRFYLARPLRMPSTDCLQCHSTPDVAPASMVAKYGANGFGWKMGDVIGMQLVEVPVLGPNTQAMKGLLVTLGALTCVFILSLSVFLLLLRRYVTHPLEAITRRTISTSLAPERHETGERTPLNGQFHDLEQSIGRLRTSLNEALRLLPDLGKRKNGP